ncbi:MAG: sigma-54-dependent transcriptional regulator [Acidobacteriaceae bacterium]
MLNEEYKTGEAGKLHVLVVDDDAVTRTACMEIATLRGFAAQGLESTEDARSLLRNHSVDVLVLDLKATSREGMQLLDQMKTLTPDTAVVVMTASGSIGSAVEAMRTGATDYLTKPFALEEFAAVLARAADRRHANGSSRSLRERLRSEGGVGNLIGRSPEMDKLYRILAKVAQSAHPVLILGESGTGKELVARAIHSQGTHPDKPFIPVDCGSFVPAMVESELFGFVKGSFPTAARDSAGLLAAAEEGTVFLDEVGEISLELQAKLLRVLQAKEVCPVGGTRPVPVKARMLAATSRDLATMTAKGAFRKDLYYRLNVVNLRIPPLRDRRSDIPLLAAHFLERMGREHGTSFTLSDEALKSMMEYDWPGNVRELENAIDRASALSSGPVLHMRDMPTQLQNYGLESHQAAAAVVVPPQESIEKSGEKPAVMPLAELEKQAILNTITQLKGDKLMAARLLGIGKTTLYRKLKEYGMTDGSPLGMAGD